jgi:predicted ABC-type ATPase
MSSDHPTLVIIRGIPGSGKSYLAAAIEKQIGPDQVVILDPDKIDKESSEYRQFSTNLTNEGVDAKFHPFRYLRQRGFDAILAHKTIMWNQAFIDLNGFQITVDRLQTFAKEQGLDLPLLVVEVEISKDTARKRIDERVASGEHDVPDEALAGFVEKYESFADHGYTTVTVNGEDDVNQSAVKVLEALKNL